jgi:tRNA(Ile)-lysidine synthase
MELDILDHIKKHDLLQDGDRVLIAVSGGPDSMALLHWFWENRRRWDLTLRAIHLNHQFRGDEADGDQQYVEHICEKWGIPCSSRKVDVSHYAKEHHLSKQVAARECRYHYFEEVARELGYNKLALAHHGDDQLETVLMRFIRGAGLSGLSGIPAIRQTDVYHIIRPFMPLSKEQLESYCQNHHISPRIDQSNLSDDYTRNQIRRHLVPQLVQLNPKLHQVVEEMTDTLALEDRFLEDVTKNYVDQVIESQKLNKLTINLIFFQQVPLPLQRRLILLLLSYLSTKRSDWNKIHIEQILDLTKKNHGSKKVDLPNQVTAIKEYHYLYLIQEKGSAEAKELKTYEEYLPSEGEFSSEHIPLKVSISTHTISSLTENLKEQPLSAFTYVASFDAEQIAFPLMVRNRLTGDKIQPLGMGGHKKVKDIFIDHKIPLSQRHGWPLIVDQEAIIWIPGLKRADRGKITERTKRLITITVDKNEGGQVEC